MGGSKGPLFWKATRLLLTSGRLEGWFFWQRNVLFKLVSRSEVGKLISPSFASRAQAPCFTAATCARPFRWNGTCVLLRSCGRRRNLSSRNTGNSLHVAFSRVPLKSCQQVYASILAQSCGTTDPQTGFWKGTSSPTGLHRAVWICGAPSSQQPTERCRTMCSPSKLRATARTTQRRRLARSQWNRSRCTSTARAPSPRSTGQEKFLCLASFFHGVQGLARRCGSLRRGFRFLREASTSPSLPTPSDG